MRSCVITALLLPCLVSAQPVGNSTARLANCASFTPPSSYLDLSFMGERAYVEAGSVNFSYFSFGPLSSNERPGKPLVMLAGQGATARVWTPDLLRGLAQARQVYTPDNMGVGLSSKSDSDYSLEAFAQSTLDFLEALGLEQPDVLGWSFGGAIAMQTTLSFPQAFSRMVITGTGVGGSGARPTPGSLAVRPSVIHSIDTGMNLDPAVIYPDTPAGNLGLCRNAAWNQAEPQDEQPSPQKSARQAQAIHQYFFSDDDSVYNNLGNITNPVLVLHGTQDLVVTFGSGMALMEGIPGASLLQWADSGHGAILQHDRASALIISAFLDADTGDGEDELIS